MPYRIDGMGCVHELARSHSTDLHGCPRCGKEVLDIDLGLDDAAELANAAPFGLHV